MGLELDIDAFKRDSWRIGVLFLCSSFDFDFFSFFIYCLSCKRIDTISQRTCSLITVMLRLDSTQYTLLNSFIHLT